jgi:PAX-interacting protein 1
MSPETFKSAVTDMRAVVRLSDSVAGSAPARRSKASVGEDLVDMTRCHLQESNLMSLDSGAAAKKVRRCVSSLPLINASSGGSLDDTRWITDVESSKMLSTATSTAKRPRLEV